MKALLFERNLARFAASRVASEFGSGRGAKIAPLRLVDADAPVAPDATWHHVAPSLSGICGSDLATIDGRSSRYFEPLVSFPFTPGHEVVGVIGEGATAADGSSLAADARVVIQPVLGCRARGIDPVCPSCAAGHTGDCEHTAFGHLSPGIQTGFCADTGGGWSNAGLVAHESQLFAVPEHLSDTDAVTVEPVACALHAVLGAGLRDDDVVAVLGAGTLGLATTGALSHLVRRGSIAGPRALVVGARYANQRTLATELGATSALPSDQLARAVRRHSRSMAMGGPSSARLTGGADVVFDCVGSAISIEASLEMVRPRGTVVLVGMPGRVSVDLASLWHREVRLAGAYAYGTERIDGEERSTFDLAIEAVAALGTGRLVSATYPLERFEEAVAHAGSAGRRGAVKIAFDLRATSRGGRR
ncbi:MAG: zinc-dependent alcohol dehydrogenase [Acidimicrobiales bacterium]